jgi:hypothetical protein
VSQNDEYFNHRGVTRRGCYCSLMFHFDNVSISSTSLAVKNTERKCKMLNVMFFRCSFLFTSIFHVTGQQAMFPLTSKHPSTHSHKAISPSIRGLRRDREGAQQLLHQLAEFALDRNYSYPLFCSLSITTLNLLNLKRGL